MSGLDAHKLALRNLCRFCGGRFTSSGSGRSYFVFDYQHLWDNWDFNFCDDDDVIHPKSFCHKCYCKLMNSDYNKRKEWKPQNDWKKHKRTEETCTTCNLMGLSSKAGRPPKKKSGGRPPVTMSSHFAALSNDCLMYSMSNFMSTDHFMLCKLCGNVLVNPCVSSCEHVFCLSCVQESFVSASRVSVPCATCQSSIHYKSVKLVPQYHLDSIHSINISCTVCKTKIPYINAKIHTCIAIQTNDHTYSRQTPITPTSNLSPTEKEILGTAILKEKLKESKDGTATFHSTKGRPLVVVLISKAQVNSNLCAPSTLRRRSDTLLRVRELASGGESSAQLAHEVQFRGLATDLEALMTGGTIRIPDGDMLDLKVGLGLSWRRHRKLKRWLKERKVLSEGEQASRAQQAKIIGDNLVGKWLPFQFHNDALNCVEFLRAPMVIVSSLQHKVLQLLEDYDKLNLLTWSHGIPNDEIWLKLGGDKGGSSFKLAIEVANLNNPNSLRNTVIVAMFKAGDNAFNLSLALQEFSQQVDMLMATSWRGKTLRLFLCGDYEFLTKAYGLTGPNGRHCCLYCDISKAQMVVPQHVRGPSPSRTLTSLEKNLEEFKTDEVARLHFNVVREPLFRIPIDQVCPPGLHISLGLFFKHFVSMERRCHELDIKVAEQLSHTPPIPEVNTQGLASLIQHQSLQRKITEVESEEKDLMEQLSFFVTLYPDESQPVKLMQEAAAEKQKEKKQLEKEIKKLPKVPQGSGPIAVSLDRALQGMQVKRQAYNHGKPFVGNHVHKCLKEENITIITTAIVETTSKLCPSLIEEAEEVAASYRTLLNLYGKCHRAFNSKHFMTDEDISQLDSDIKEYVTFFRENWPSETNPPKLHLTEDHIIPWLRRWKAPFGLMGEQGIESLHSHLNTIESDLRGFNNDLDVLLHTVKTHWVHSNPRCYGKEEKEK